MRVMPKNLRKRGSLFAAAAILASAGWTVLAQPPAAAIDSAALSERIRYLASDALAGRGTGTRGAEEAAGFIASVFRGAGLKPIGTSDAGNAAAPLNGSGYFQPFLYTAGVARGKGNTLSAEFSGKTVAYRVETEFSPAGISGSGSAAGPVVFCGYGIQSKDPARDDYAGQDVKGKIVLLLAGHPGDDPHSPLSEFAGIHHKALFARDLGAAAVLVASPKDSAPPPTNGSDYRDEGVPVFLIRRSIATDWLAAAGQNLEAAEERLRQGSAPMPLPVRVSLSADVEKVQKTTANVAGLLEGSDPQLRGEFVFIGAHYDHLGMGGPSSLAESREPAIHHGADDNASGAAGVMALADFFASRKIRPRRSLVFLAFSGEELGLLGSAYYVKHPLLPLASSVAMFNMDMIGRLRDDKLAVIGSGSSPDWDAIVADATRDTGLKVNKSEGAFGASDQQSFYTAKVPVLFFFTGVHTEYHRPSDTADKINIAGEVRVLNVVARCAEKVAQRPERPGYREVPASAAPTTTSFRVYFGSIPDYAAEVEGVQIAGVREGSPAEKAGLKSGDIVVKFGGHGIRNVQDYTIALSGNRPGDVVQVVVRRGQKEEILSATLEAPRH
jgi:aminopeptidase YwaD